MNRFHACLFSAAFLLAGLTGCQTLNNPFGGKDDEKTPGIYVIQLLQIAAQLAESNLVVRLPCDNSGRYVWVRRIPLIASVEATTITATEHDDGTTTLAAKLSPHGQAMWIHTMADLAGEYVAVTVDGKYRFQWRVPSPSTGKRDIMAIRGPWDPTEAREICERSALNRKKRRNY